MKAQSKRKSSQQKVQKHRERLRSLGLRPIQIWLPDVRSPLFVAEAHRQSVSVGRAPGERDDQRLIDALCDLPIE